MMAKRKQRRGEPEAPEMAGYVVVVTTLQELQQESPDNLNLVSAYGLHPPGKSICA